MPGATNHAMDLLHSTSRGRTTRVCSIVGLEIKESQIAGAGEGVFVLEPVKAGDLIFSVPKPPISIVSIKRLRSTCDNCFAHDSSDYKTTNRGALDFQRCQGCGILSYCSQSCRDEAWNQHHQYECQILTKLQSSKILSAKRQQRGKEGPPKLSMRIRCIIRILALYGAKQFTMSEWKEFRNLVANIEESSKNTKTVALVRNMVEVLIESHITDLQEAEIQQLIYAALNNSCEVFVSPLSSKCHLTEAQYDTVTLGTCLEPFFAKLNHSCIPNAYWCFNGREMQVRAEKYIEAGQELLIGYIPRDTYDTRKRLLAKGWGFECSCRLCSGPHRGHRGSLNTDLRELLDKAIEAEKDGDLKLEYAKQGMRQLSTYGFEFWEMRQFFSQIYKGHYLNSEAAEMLKIWLTICFVVEPDQQQRPSLMDRISQLRLLVSLTDAELLLEQGMKEYRPMLKMLVGDIHPFLRANLIRGIERCYGRDSEIYKYESKLYVQTAANGAFKRESWAVGEMGQVIIMERKENLKRKFLGHMNDLLDYFGIARVTERDLV